MIAWTDIENALRAWLVAAVENLADPDSVTVIFEAPDGPRPSHPYVTIKVSPPTRLGMRDPERQAYVPSNPNGQQIVLTYEGQREITVSLNAYTATRNGDSCASAIMAAIQSHLETDTARDALSAVGLAVRESGPVRDLGSLVEGGHRGRAQMDVRFGLVDATVERTTWIETVGIEPTYR